MYAFIMLVEAAGIDIMLL
jgi:5'-3' exonuclease